MEVGRARKRIERIVVDNLAVEVDDAHAQTRELALGEGYFPSGVEMLENHLVDHLEAAVEFLGLELLFALILKYGEATHQQPRINHKAQKQAILIAKFNL